MSDARPRQVPAVHAARPITADPLHETSLAMHLKATLAPEAIAELYGRFCQGRGPFDAMMRKVVWRALARDCGDALVVAPGAGFRHLERISLGAGVFVGEGAMLQGHAHGECVIGDRVWIGPQAFLDARALTVGDAVAIGPGARVLTAEHTGLPTEAAVMATDQVLGPVRIGDGADVGVGAVVLPGRSIGRGAIVGAAAVVAHDLPDGAVAVGSPARVLRLRGEGPGARR